MSWSDTTLCGLLRNKEEVEALVISLVLYKTFIDDAAWWWIFNLTSIATCDEHSLINSFIYNNQSDKRKIS